MNIEKELNKYFTQLKKWLIKWKLIPYNELILKSPLDRNQIETKLKLNLEWTKKFGVTFSKNSKKKYEGFVKDDSFKFRRILKSGRNSFIPIVHGKVENDNEKSIIRIKIKYPKWVSVGLIVFTIFIASVSLSTTCANRHNNYSLSEEIDMKELRETLGSEKYDDIFQANQPRSRVDNWTSKIVFLTAYMLVIVFFNIETNSAKDDLKFMISAEEDYHS